MALIMAPPSPVIITDKSAIESLSPDEARFLFKHLFVNIPPILLTEVLADLSKLRKGEDSPAVRVIALANKSRDIDSLVNLNYRAICTNSLLGSNFPMDGRCIASNPSRTVTSKQGTGIVIDESQYEKDLLRWQFGDFSDEEKQSAYMWREMTKKLDLNRYKTGFESFGVKIPRVKTCPEIREATEALLTDQSLQAKFLSWLLAILNSLPNSTKQSIANRWNSGSEIYIRGFAPYAHYCLKVYLTFVIGLESNLFSKKPTNRLDLEYCFYFPFCQAFTSKDKFLIQIAPLLLEPFQNFVETLELKADLVRLAQEWQGLSSEQKRERSVHYGKRPLVDKASVVSRLWEKHMAPHKPFSGNIVSAMPKEEVASIAEFLEKLTNEIEESEQQPKE